MDLDKSNLACLKAGINEFVQYTASPNRSPDILDLSIFSVYVGGGSLLLSAGWS